jgi:signal peptidase I
VTSSADDDRDSEATDESRSSVLGGRSAKGGKRSKRKTSELPLWQEVIVLLALALGLAIVLKSLFIQAFYIPSDSMRDTLIVNDRILVQKVSYWFDDQPERGDIVVFKDPGGWLGGAAVEPSGVTKALEFFGLYPTGDHLVKRVIGVGGDRVKCCNEDGRITINGEPLDERGYLMAGMAPGAGNAGTFDVEVPEGELWVMGDNRAESADSRAHQGDPGGGTIPVEDVVGKVFLTVWPLNRASVTDHPESFERIGPPQRSEPGKASDPAQSPANGGQ